MLNEISEEQFKQGATIVSGILESMLSITPETLDYTLELIGISDNELKSVKILHAEKQYAHSVYFLQQAIEKSTKSFGLSLGIIKLDQLKGKDGINHKSPKVFLEMIKTTTWGAEVTKMMEQQSNKPDISKVENIINDEDKQIEIAKADKNTIELLFKVVDDLDKNLQIEKSETNNDELDMFEFSKGNCFLYLISCYSWVHFIYTRYPEEKMKPKDYTEELGIVSETPKIVSRIEKINSDLRKYVLMMKGNDEIKESD
ncbi:Uncharacterised protein [uncultured archaeon]|nr:Uncharacterised protein [uncultured archaeon]